DGGIAGHFVGVHVAAQPMREGGMGRRVHLGGVGLAGGGRVVFGPGEAAGDGVDVFLGQRVRAALDQLPLFVDLPGVDFRRQVLDQDLDARLEFVVAPAVHVVDPQRGLQVGEQVLPFDERV